MRCTLVNVYLAFLSERTPLLAPGASTVVSLTKEPVSSETDTSVIDEKFPIHAPA
jgi:hypothetical protein